MHTRAQFLNKKLYVCDVNKKKRKMLPTRQQPRVSSPAAEKSISTTAEVKDVRKPDGNDEEEDASEDGERDTAPNDSTPSAPAVNDRDLAFLQTSLEKKKREVQQLEHAIRQMSGILYDGPNALSAKVPEGDNSVETKDQPAPPRPSKPRAPVKPEMSRYIQRTRGLIEKLQTKREQYRNGSAQGNAPPSPAPRANSDAGDRGDGHDIAPLPLDLPQQEQAQHP